MKKILLLLLFSCFFTQAQDSIVIQGKLEHNTRFAKVVIKKFGIGIFDIAAVPIKEGSFSIKAPINLEAGVYRLHYSQDNLNEYVDVIINGKEKNISFSLDLLEAPEIRKPFFNASLENQNWYTYQSQSQVQLQKIEALKSSLSLYPNTTDKIVLQIKNAVLQEQLNYKKQESVFIKNNPNSWAILMVQNNPYYFTNPKEDWRIQDFDRRTHFWEGIDTNNPKLINSPLYTNHILNYLKYYMNPEMHFSEDEMNEGFKKSVDTIMQRFGSNYDTKKFALQYLQLGFKEIGNEKVLQYIDEKYKDLATQCQDEIEKTAFEKRMAGYEAMKEGVLAPNITFANKSTLYDIQSEQTLIVFWASWCPHCQEEMPKINEWAKAHPAIKVVAISLDDDQMAYEAAIQKYPNIFHTTDLKKWDSKAVSDYYIYGTPTFVKLDKDKKIVAKQSSFEQILKSF
jgi:thiol-disulfide isomerase/thioredoxin